VGTGLVMMDGNNATDSTKYLWTQSKWVPSVGKSWNTHWEFYNASVLYTDSCNRCYLSFATGCM